MKNQIPEFLRKQFKKKMPKIRFFPEDVKKFILDYNKFYELHIPEANMKLIYKLIKQKITKREKCQLDGCEKLQGFDVFDKLTIGCCRAHSQQITNRLRYGVSNYATTAECIQKIKNVNLERYGVSNYAKTAECQQKIKNTCLHKFGVEHVMYVPEIKEKSKNEMLKTIKKAIEKRTVTMLERFGETTNLKCADTKEKIKKTNLEKYGDENTFGKNSLVRKRVEQERFEIYGVYYNTQIPEVCEKQQNARYKRKTYTWKTGETSYVQGYEPIVLRELEDSGYAFKDVLTSKKDMPEIWYYYNNKKRRYFPDMHIPKENLIIEVKSDYTANANKEVNDLKFAAVKELGYNFKLEIR